MEYEWKLNISISHSFKKILWTVGNFLFQWQSYFLSKVIVIFSFGKKIDYGKFYPAAYNVYSRLRLEHLIRTLLTASLRYILCFVPITTTEIDRYAKSNEDQGHGRLLRFLPEWSDQQIFCCQVRNNWNNQPDLFQIE